MAIWESAMITNKGLALLAKLVNGNTLSLVRAVAGSGYVDPATIKEQIYVTDETQELTFGTVRYLEEGSCAVMVKLTNTGIDTTYQANQIGIMASDPDEGEILFLISQAKNGMGTTVPSETEMPGFSAAWNFKLQYGQADGVTVVVDPSGAVSSSEVQSMIDAHASNKENPHGVTAEQLGLGNVDNTADTDKYVAYAQRAGSADKAKYAITIRLDGGRDEGTNQWTYDGSVSKSVNITPEKIGAAEAEHVHKSSEITGLATVATTGKFSDLLEIPMTIEGGGDADTLDGYHADHFASADAEGLKKQLAAGMTILSSHQYGPSLPAAGNPGRLFFKKVSS